MPNSRLLPVDVEADQVWRERNGDQHWKVLGVRNQVATLQRCMKVGQVLNTRYKKSMSEDDMQAQLVFVGRNDRLLSRFPVRTTHQRFGWTNLLGASLKDSNVLGKPPIDSAGRSVGWTRPLCIVFN